ncbi:Dihydropteroate synthase [Natranaerofaba carboxydovora]|nr:dihydropteroate synthase [Natranaerofaba carboxydovora]UMZ74918.1 Dihydropteroate synthase [Natranaerofaba carboxydovora]
MGIFSDLGKKTYIMGVLNVTPDSFSDGGDFIDSKKALRHAKEMEKEGADIIDIGGESTRPGSVEIDAKEEMRRIEAPLKMLVKEIKTPVSVDTYKASVAKEVLDMGASIINDVWGMQKDPDMAGVAAEYDVPVVLMHNKKKAYYEGDIMEEIKDFLKKSINIAKEGGVSEDKIIVDPGIGFGKEYEHSVEVMKRLDELKELGYPMLLGTSRKRMIGNILDLPPKERVEGTVATTVAGIFKGVDIVRVHDVKENYRAARVIDCIYRE